LHAIDIPDRRYLKKNDPIADTFGPLKSIACDFYFLIVSEKFDEADEDMEEKTSPMPYLATLKLRQEEMQPDLLNDEYLEDHNISIDWEEAGKQFIDDIKMTARSSGKHSIIKSLTKDQGFNKGEEGDLLDFNLDLEN
jgi:hypothetical protein